jgi:hypothetical protein
VKKEVGSVPLGVTTSLKYFDYRDSTYKDPVERFGSLLQKRE